MYMLADDRSPKEFEKKRMLWNWEENSQFYSSIICIFFWFVFSRDLRQPEIISKNSGWGSEDIIKM